MDSLLELDDSLVLGLTGRWRVRHRLDRKIIYWNKAAERITGWGRADIIGRHCFDDILCHVDKDAHQLCGQEHCPLHRSIITGVGSECPLVFAKRKDGQRVPVQVTVAPIRNADRGCHWRCGIVP